MKNIILILIMILAFGCKAQSPIIPYNSLDILENSYCKDLNNDLNKFVGTWNYVNGNTELCISVVKNEQVDLDSYYIDELAGNYKYIDNGIVIANTLNNDYNENASFSGDNISADTNKFTLSLTDPGKSRASYKVELNLLGSDTNGN